MNYKIVKEFPNEIIFEKKEPCISLYQPTHRHRQDRKQDIIRFKNLVKEIEESLSKDYAKDEIENMMDRFYKIEKDAEFWNASKDGLVILANPDNMIIYKINRPLQELAIVSDSFHIKPLVRVYQSADTYYVLGLNRQRFQLFVGNRYELKEVEFDENTPVNIEDVLGEELTDPFLYARAGGGETAMFHGHGSKKDEINKDIERYFRYIDKLITTDFSNPTKSPLILVTLDEYQGMFRGLTHNRWLVEEGIKKDFETLDIKELRNLAWEVAEPYYIDRTHQLVDRFNIEYSNELASSDLAEVSKFAIAGRVEVLLLESDKILPGKISKINGDINLENLGDPEVDDILDDLAEVVLQNKGEVVMLPKEKMPSSTGLAAIYRY